MFSGLKAKTKLHDYLLFSSRLGKIFKWPHAWGKRFLNVFFYFRLFMNTKCARASDGRKTTQVIVNRDKNSSERSANRLHGMRRCQIVR